MSQLHITGYAADRLGDVARLHKCRTTLFEHLGIKSSDNCVHKQLVSRWERRRTKSVYRYIRGRQLKERARLSSGKRLKVMKNRRHRRYSINSLIFDLHDMNRYDHDNIKWLETHKWMRKRLKMKNLWGYCISTQHMGRGMKSVIRAAESHCIIHDSSYIKPIEVLIYENLTIFLDNIFSEFVDPSCSFLTSPTDNEYKEIPLLVYSRGSFPHNCYGPIKICYLPSESLPNRPNKVWIWTHPTFYKEFFDELQQCVSDYYNSNTDDVAEKIVVQNITSGINRFSIIGVGAASLIANAFPTHENVSADSVEAFYNKVINSEGLLRVWQNGEILGINALDHRYPRENNARNGYKRSYERLIWPGSNASCTSDLWDEQTRARASTIFLPDHQLNMRKNLLNSARMQLKCLAPTATNDASPVLGQALFPILIVRNDLAYRAHSSNIDHASVQGWDIIVPSRWGASIFNHLHLLGGRVAGIEELEYLHLYHGHISFPRDFPDTEAGETYWLDKSVERNKKIYLWNKCKPTKAAKATYSGDVSDSSDESDNDDDASHCSDSEMVVEEIKGSTTDSHREPVTNMNIVVEAAEEVVSDDNFFKDYVIVRDKEYLESFDPLLPNSDGIDVNPLPTLPFSTLVTVLLHRVGKGMPAVGAAVYSPTLSDYRLYAHYHANKTKQTSLRGTRLGKWTGVELTNTSTPYNSHIFSSGTSDIEDEQGTRTLLGYITGGSQYHYHFSDKAIGLCDITRLHESYLALIEASSSIGRTQCDHACSLVLYRNPNSKWLRPALSKII